MNVITPLPLDARARAEEEQRQASDPAVSAFVSASAGSGKTKLLTDRMLRLMLGGADPSRIQCLTFTKAAAAEMSLRLQSRLGRWVTLDDDALDWELRELRVDPSAAALAKARELFATILDLPGGMRIGTIHAFCQSLLRRFPIEAAISPHFRLVEDTDARQAMDQAREGVLARTPPGELRELAGLANAERFATLVGILEGQRARLDAALQLAEPRLAAAMRRVAGAGGASDAGILAAGVSWPAEGAVTAALRLAHEEGTPAVKEKAGRMLAWLGLDAGPRHEHWAEWLAELLKGDGAPRAVSVFAAKKLAEKHPSIPDALGAEQARVLAVEDSRRALRVADASTALLRLARPVLRAYAGRKQDMGFLDYGDLIGRTSQLLVDPGAAWVMYKLDGGIDHLLLDEVQDTAPEQWQIAHRLTEEFFAGQGARAEEVGGKGAPARTFFAVGDPKQSIYSFQGADPEEFGRSHDRMAARVGGSAQEWRDVTLDVSFRSTTPVLALVDAVFADPVAARGVAEEGGLQHYADRAGFAGQVELWPLTPLPEEEEAAPWTVPDRNMGLVSAPQRLADALARFVDGELRDGVLLQSRNRPLAAGDVLVLVRRRDAFARALVRALKARGVPVAGLDRLVLTEQAAVQDMLAACDAVLLPEDDLAVACVLTSPLGGLTDESLMRLAMERCGTLWEALRDRAGEREVWRQAWTFLSTLQSRADHVTPHALLSEALEPLGGRARLLARLGPEAAEPLDELLSAALAYTATHAPALQGFVHWMRRSGAEVKREAEGAGGAVRVMTVHGAKGLQAPLVILPDTTGLPPEDDAFHWVRDAVTGADLPLWSPRRELRCAAVQRAQEAERDRRLREYNRLLYVALTRAEDRLLVCGWHTKRGVAEDSWYRMAERGFRAIGAAAEPFGAVSGAWEGERLVQSSPQTAKVMPMQAARARAAASLPPWAGRPGDWRPEPPPPEPPLPVPLAPSRPDGASLGPVPRAASPLQARDDAGRRFLRGNLVHTLLQHLPDLPDGEREAAALEHLGRPGFGLPWAEVADLAAQVMGVLRHPELAPLFGPEGRTEQPLAGLVGGTVVTGVVDRLAVLPGEVWLADYKTHRDAPRDVADTPVRYLRQLAAYRAVLRGVFPGRPIRCALVWTQGAVVAMLPGALLDAHAPA
jgi:ATP-dependent helicase/nuclease subunit A